MINLIKAGTKAPNFTLENINGAKISLEDFKGKKIWLSFYRYVSCPACSLQLRNAARNFTKWENENFVKLAIFQTPIVKIRENLNSSEFPFYILSDSEENVYNLYSSQKSWISMLNPKMLPMLTYSMLKGNLPGKPDGSLNRMPAEFLIDESGIIQHSHFAKHITDHIEFERITQFLKVTHEQS